MFRSSLSSRASAPLYQQWAQGFGRRTTRTFSSAPSQAKKGAETDEVTPKQPFVTARLEPGEWDEARRDPYFRPKPPKHAKLISAEDFANRPPVGFDGAFSTYQDAMISLSWLDQKTSKAIYSQYVDMMVLSQQNHQTTSHEYVVRVLAQKYQLTPWRAAGIIQLQHSEEQMRQHNPELLCEEQAKYAEETILQNIRDAYRAERQQLPRSSSPRGGDNNSGSIPFIEDPVGIHGRGEPDETSTQWARADDIYDMDQKLKQANVRDSERARLLIDGHVYKEDVDETKELVRADASCRRLLKAKEQQKASTATNGTDIPYPETNAQGEKRERWKFVAKVVNTRDMKKKGRKVPTYTNNSMENTLVEHNGTLRVATVGEAKEAAWKPTRTKSNEYLFEGAKKAWLEKTLNGKSGVWGAAPKSRASDATAAAQKQAEAKATEEKEEQKSDNDSAEQESAGETTKEVEGGSEESPTKENDTGDKKK